MSVDGLSVELEEVAVVSIELVRISEVADIRAVVGTLGDVRELAKDEDVGCVTVFASEFS